MTTKSVVRGKLVTFTDGQSRFFPALNRGPLGACDSALEHETDDNDPDPKATAALDAREAELDYREAADDEGKNDEEARDRKLARDRRAIARDRRAHDRRASGARDEEGPSREEAYLKARDGNPDHRRDFDPLAARDKRGARDSRRIAHDAALAGVDLRELFPSS